MVSETFLSCSSRPRSVGITAPSAFSQHKARILAPKQNTAAARSWLSRHWSEFGSLFKMKLCVVKYQRSGCWRAEYFGLEKELSVVNKL